LPCFFL
jgi:hypothetical protein